MFVVCFFVKEPLEHESLLIDRKETKLSASEKRIAHRNYQLEKSQSSGSVLGPGTTGYSYNRPSYAAFYPQNNVDPGIPLHSSVTGSVYNNSMYSVNRNYQSSFDHHTKPVDNTISFQQKMAELQKIQQRRLLVAQQERALQQQFQQEFLPQSSSQYQSRKSLHNNNFPFQALKDRGIDVQSMLVKKDAFMKGTYLYNIYTLVQYRL